MNYADQGSNRVRNLIGFGVAALFQAFLIFALVTGLGKNIVEKLRAPIETKIIKEDKPPPPPPPPPPPTLAAPPPPYIPPPDIQIQPPPQETHAIQAVTNKAPPPGPIVIQRTAPAVPDSGPSSQPAVGSSRPEYPEAYQDQQRAGTVTVSCTIQPDGRPTGCSLINVSGGAAFGSAVMSWLHSGSALYKPAVRNGQKISASAQLQIHFNPAE